MSTEFEQWIAEAARAQRKAQQEMDLELLIAGEIDEVSILFKSERTLDVFVHWAEEVHGMDHFNSVPNDTMIRRWDFGLGSAKHNGAFDVRFEFLRLDGAAWRIEAMCVTEGMSGVHDPLPEGACVHASYKPGDLSQYAHARFSLEHRLPLLAEFNNSYGRFCYFGDRPPYIKPRVNLRDGSS